MPATGKSQEYLHVAADIEGMAPTTTVGHGIDRMADGQRPFARRPCPLSYKPTVIKAPSLILFVLILISCVLLIEIIFHQSSIPDSSTSQHDKRARVEARSTTQGSLASSATTSGTVVASLTATGTVASLVATSSSIHTSTTAAVQNVHVSTVTALTSDLLTISSSSSVGAITTTPSPVLTVTITSTGALLVLSSSSAQTISGTTSQKPTIASTIVSALLTISSSPQVKLSSTTQATSYPPESTFFTATSAFLTISSSPQVKLSSTTQATSHPPESTFVSATSAFLTISSSPQVKSSSTTQATPNPTPPAYDSGTAAFLTISSSFQVTPGTPSPTTGIQGTSRTAYITTASAILVLSASGQTTPIAASLTAPAATYTVISGLLVISSSVQTILPTSPETTITAGEPITSTTAASGLLIISSTAPSDLLTVSSNDQVILTTLTQNPVRIETSAAAATTDLLLLSSNDQRVSPTAIGTGSFTEIPISTSPLTTTHVQGTLPLTSSQTNTQVRASAKPTSALLDPTKTSAQNSVTSYVGNKLSSNSPSATISGGQDQTSSQVNAATKNRSSGSSGLSPGYIISSIPTLYTVTTQYTSLIVTTDRAGHSTSILAVVVVQTVVSTSPDLSATVLSTISSNGLQSPTKVMSDVSSTGSTSSTASPWPIATMSPTEMVVNGTFTPFKYFAALYLTPIIAIIIKAFWETIYAAFKMMEPFQRLSKPGGASANRALFKQYLSNSISLDAIRTCFSGILPLLTTAIYLLVTIVTVLSASSMTVRARGNCETPSGGYLRCDPGWIIDRPILRCLEALLFICILYTLLVIVFSWRYRSNVASNPSSIASVASLFNQESMIRDFNQVEPSVDNMLLASTLRHRHCRLEYHESASGRLYGITQKPTADLAGEKSGRKSSHNPLMYWIKGYESVTNPTTSRQGVGSSGFISIRMQAILLDTAQLLTTIVLFVLVVAYYLDGKSDALNDFFNSGSFWARFTFVGIATLLDTQWKRLEREVRITEPYRRMAKGFARPETTILLSLNGTCWSELPGSIYRFLRFRHMWFQTLVSLIAALSDLNIIAVAGIAYSDAQTALMLKVGSYVAIGITSLMMIVMLITMAWWRRGIVGQMPRTPDTVGAIFSYLCASRLIQQLGMASLEEWTEEERNEIIINSGWRFWFGKRIGKDGVERWVIDFEDTGNFQRKFDGHGNAGNSMRRDDGDGNVGIPEMHHLIRSHH